MRPSQLLLSMIVVCLPHDQSGLLIALHKPVFPCCFSALLISLYSACFLVLVPVALSTPAAARHLSCLFKIFACFTNTQCRIIVLSTKERLWSNAVRSAGRATYRQKRGRYKTQVTGHRSQVIVLPIQKVS